MPLQPKGKAVAVSESISAVALEALSGFNHGWTDDDDQGLPIGKRKPKDHAKKPKGKPPGGNRWGIAVDYRIASPLIDAPSAGGRGRNLHFSWTYVNKGAVPTFEGRPLWPSESGKAGAHSRYVERDFAPERYASTDYAVYMENEEKADGLGRLMRLTDFEEAFPGEIPDKSSSPPFDDVKVSIFSNIEASRRYSMWDAAWRCERKARRNYLDFDPESCPQWWREFDIAAPLSYKLRNHILDVRAAFLRHESDLNPDKKAFRAKSLKVSAREAGRFLMELIWLGNLPDVAVAKFRPGKTGRVQYRLVASLPHELGAADRGEIALGLCDLLPKGVMYTCVIHAPGRHNDRRNYHLHLIMYDRPCRYLEEHDCWDFEYVDSIKDPRHPDRDRYPFRQPKVPEVSQYVEGIEGSGLNFIPSLRKSYVSLLNEKLGERGFAARYDHRSLEDQGVKANPTLRLRTGDVALERAGVPTQRGSHNARILWQRIEQEELADAHRTAGIFEVVKEVREVAETEYPNAREALSLCAAILAECGRLQREQTEMAQVRVTEKKARSRALRTKETCEVYLDDIDTGRASQAIRRDEAAIRRRLEEAETWLKAIDRAVEPLRESLTAAETEASACAARLLVEVRRLRAMVKDLERTPQRSPVSKVTERDPVAVAEASPAQVAAAKAAYDRIEDAHAPAPITEDDRIKALVGLIGRSARGEAYVAIENGRAVALVDHAGLREALEECAREPRVAKALDVLKRQHLCAEFDALVERERPCLDGVTPGAIASIRTAIIDHPRTLFASRDPEGVQCLSTRNDNLARLMTWMSDAPRTLDFVDDLHRLLRGCGESAVEGHRIGLPPVTALSGRRGAGRGGAER
jgi:hypothetical protein